MAEFFKTTTKQMNMGAKLNHVGVMGDATPSNGPANAKLPKTDTKVGAMGDNAASNSSDSGPVKATSKVGATGDRAAKSGK